MNIVWMNDCNLYSSFMDESFYVSVRVVGKRRQQHCGEPRTTGSAPVREEMFPDVLRGGTRVSLSLECEK